MFFTFHLYIFSGIFWLMDFQKVWFGEGQTNNKNEFDGYVNFLGLEIPRRNIRISLGKYFGIELVFPKPIQFIKELFDKEDKVNEQ